MEMSHPAFEISMERNSWWTSQQGSSRSRSGIWAWWDRFMTPHRSRHWPWTPRTNRGAIHTHSRAHQAGRWQWHTFKLTLKYCTRPGQRAWQKLFSQYHCFKMINHWFKKSKHSLIFLLFKAPKKCFSCLAEKSHSTYAQNGVCCKRRQA
jgi:hypothetical protein